MLNQLSSQRRDRTEYSNRKAAIRCQDDPELLAEIAAGLRSDDLALAGDCAEVMTMVAQEQAELVAPYAEELARQLTQRNARVRWEAAHALALIAPLVPASIAGILPTLAAMMRSDPSVIARDHATDILSGYAATGEEAAREAYPLLKEMLTLWNGKQASHALLGMVQVARMLPEKHAELKQLGQEFSSFPRPVVRKAAKVLLRYLDGRELNPDS